LGIYHGTDQFLDAALRFGLALSELGQANFVGFEARSQPIF
jgi:hypothetical protein